MMASAGLSTRSVEVDSFHLAGTDSQQDEAGMVNPNLRMFGSFLSMDLQKNPKVI